MGIWGDTKMLLGGHRVFLVEDDALIAFDIRNIIREAHGEVVAYAANLPKALRLANTPGLSLAILDFELGRDNSLPVATKLHAAGVPFVFHTGHAACLSEMWPFVPVVPKPASPNKLVGALVSLITIGPSVAAA